jgi:hypothetical protein
MSNLLTKSKNKVKFLTSMFFVTTNNKEINYLFFCELLFELTIIQQICMDLGLDTSIRDVIGWHDC